MFESKCLKEHIYIYLKKQIKRFKEMYEIPFVLKFSHKLKVLKYSLQATLFLTSQAKIKQQNQTKFLFFQDVFMDGHNDKEFLYIRCKLSVSWFLKPKLKPIIETAKEKFWTNLDIFENIF